MVKKFNEKSGVVYNPYIGFTSFQHFRGEKLYSDCIVDSTSGIAHCETENYECYPVPEGVEENGRSQGYYPDTTVAYIRVLWKEFEREQGVYDYDFIQTILDKAKEKGQTVMFRLMPHSTCSRDDVPDWLKEIMPCPERPDGMRVKDSPTDPRYLKLFGKAVEAFGLRFDSNKTLDCMDVSLGGAWGEGHQKFPKEDTEALMDIYIRVFKNSKLLGQCSNGAMLNYIAKQRAIGWRSDGTGHSNHTNIWLPTALKNLEHEHWKTAPISFESYWWISEWYRHGWNIDEVIERTLSLHISTFNTKSFPIQYAIQDKIEYWLTKMGYRYYLKEIEHSDSVKAGDNLKVAFSLENKGVAPIYNKLPLTIKLKGEKEYVIETNIDITKWLPGTYNEVINVDTKDFEKGEYTLQLAIGGGENPAVQLATEVDFDGLYHNLSKVEII